MNARKNVSPHCFGSDLARVDAHEILPVEYEEIPELTDEMFARGVIKKSGKIISTNPSELIYLHLPAEVVERWKATGPDWQDRMAELLSKF